MNTKILVSLLATVALLSACARRDDRPGVGTGPATSDPAGGTAGDITATPNDTANTPGGTAGEPSSTPAAPIPPSDTAPAPSNPQTSNPPPANEQ